MADDLEETIRTAAARPKRVSVDDLSVETHSLKELIDADRHLAGNDAITAKKRGIVLARFRHQGSV